MTKFFIYGSEYSLEKIRHTVILKKKFLISLINYSFILKLIRLRLQINKKIQI